MSEADTDWFRRTCCYVHFKDDTLEEIKSKLQRFNTEYVLDIRTRSSSKDLQSKIDLILGFLKDTYKYKVFQ